MLSENKPKITLSVSCVYYDTEPKVFDGTITSLKESIDFAKRSGIELIDEIHLINNNPAKEKWFFEWINNSQSPFIIHNGHGNVGYGKGNNLALLNTASDFHLILNPDVVLAKDNIVNAINYMMAHPDTNLLAADAFDPNGHRLYLAKRQPTALVLLTRALNISWLNRLLKKQLAFYEYRDLIPSDAPINVELVSGCYMLLRTPKAQEIGGFDDKYFMYFEDFDLSRRLQRKELVFSVRIYHLGGRASRKGVGHIKMFFISMAKYLQSRKK